MLTLTKVRLHTGKVKQHITVRVTELAQNLIQRLHTSQPKRNEASRGAGGKSVRGRRNERPSRSVGGRRKRQELPQPRSPRSPDPTRTPQHRPGACYQKSFPWAPYLPPEINFRQTAPQL